jgi:hypothetical protein
MSIDASIYFRQTLSGVRANQRPFAQPPRAFTLRQHDAQRRGNFGIAAGDVRSALADIGALSGSKLVFAVARRRRFTRRFRILFVRRATFGTLLVLVAWSAKAGWYPVFSPSFVQLRPGESATLIARGWFSGISLDPFTPMTFVAEDPAVAVIDGFLPTAQPVTVRITARRPGVTRALVLERGDAPPLPTSPVIVVADQGLLVEVRVDGTTAVGQPLRLRATSAEADATFTWYWGPIGGLYTWEIGNGRELTVVPTAPLVYEYWVLMTSPRGAGTASIAVKVERQGHRRAVIH